MSQILRKLDGGGFIFIKVQVIHFKGVYQKDKLLILRRKMKSVWGNITQGNFQCKNSVQKFAQTQPKHPAQRFVPREKIWCIQTTAKLVTTIMDKIFETNSSILVKQHTTGKVQTLFSKSFLLVFSKCSLPEKD